MRRCSPEAVINRCAQALSRGFLSPDEAEAQLVQFVKHIEKVSRRLHKISPGG